MTKDEAGRRIREIGIVPVIRAESSAQARAASDAVCEGGVPIVEITMTVPGAIGVIAELARTVGDQVLVGAGTVLDADTAARCFDAGARFLVSPGFDAATVEYARSNGVLMMTGALTPTEVIAAWKHGADFVKIFPCGSVGGPKYIKALKGPLPQIPMVPTGGVNLQTAAEFIAAGAEALGIGGELVSADLLRAGNFAAISALTRLYVEIVRAARQARLAGTK